MSTNKRQIAAFLSRTPPFAGAPEAEIEALAAACSLHRFSPGACVYTEGDRVAASWLVREGRARILNFAGGTRTIQVESLGPGDLFGLYCRLGSRTPYLCTAVADGDLTAIRIPDRAFDAAVRRSLTVARCTAECCAERMRSLKRMARFGRESVVKRVVATLLALRAQYGDEIPATRHELSTWVGAAQETVFRALAELRSAGILRTERGRVLILDAGKLLRAGAEPEQ